MYFFKQTSSHFCLLVLLAIILCTSSRVSLAAGEELTIVSWGGAHAYALERAYYQPYTEASGVTIKSHTYKGGLEQLRKQVKSGSVIWDAVDISAADANRACAEGLLEVLPLDQFSNGPDKLDSKDDFISGGLTSCAVAYSVWSTVLTYDANHFSDKSPKTISDLFDVQTFPGKRGLRRSPRGIFEWALIADGVEPEALYRVLSTEKGVKRALAKLQTIKSDIVWWSTTGEMEELLVSNEIVMGAAYSTEAFDAVVKRQRPFAFVWDGHLINANFFAVPKGSFRFTSAWQFIRFVSEFDRMPLLADYVAYGPTRRSSLTRIKPEYLAYLPTSEVNFSLGIQQDDIWWAEHHEKMNARFIEWLSSPLDTIQ